MGMASFKNRYAVRDARPQPENEEMDQIHAAFEGNEFSVSENLCNACGFYLQDSQEDNFDPNQDYCNAQQMCLSTEIMSAGCAAAMQQCDLIMGGGGDAHGHKKKSMQQA